MARKNKLAGVGGRARQDASAQLRRCVGRFAGKRIAVLGDLMLDRYLWGSATRLSPESPVPVVDLTQQSEVLGGAGNVAANLAALGAAVQVFGATGADSAAAAMQEGIRAAGLLAKGVVADRGRVTTLKTRIIARHQQVVRVDQERREGLSDRTREKMLRALFTALPKVDALVLSDYDKGVVSDDLADRVLSACHRLNVPVFVKPKTSRLYAYRGARAIVCNAKEAGNYLAQSLGDDAAVEQAGRALLAHFGCAAVVITRGEKGMSVFEESTPRHVDIAATSFEVNYGRIGQPGVERGISGRQVFDVTGAGDTVLSVLALAVVAGAEIPDAARLANAAAGVVVGKLGTATLTREELLAAVDEQE